MMHHRFRLEREHYEGYWTVLAGTDTLGDSVLLSEAEDYRFLVMRIVDTETGDNFRLPVEHRKHHKGKHHEMAYRAS